jgi:hypothetical protein
VIAGDPDKVTGDLLLKISLLVNASGFFYAKNATAVMKILGESGFEAVR